MSLSPDDPADRAVVLVGNPSPGSRTGAVARALAAALAAPGAPAPHVLELADLGAAAVADGSVAAHDAEHAVRAADVLLVATPVHKAGFTGLLKLFLDRLEPTALAGSVVVPVVLSASGAHGVLADLQLRTVLQAVGAQLPVPSFLLEEHQLDELPQYVDAWSRRFGPVVGAVVRALTPREVAHR